MTTVQMNSTMRARKDSFDYWVEVEGIVYPYNFAGRYTEELTVWVNDSYWDVVPVNSDYLTHQAFQNPSISFS